MSPTFPTYALRDIQAAVAHGRYWITRSARTGAAQLELDEDDIRDCISQLRRSHFDKTMPSNLRHGLFQDVYRCGYCGHRIYLKVQMSLPDEAVVISFKEE